MRSSGLAKRDIRIVASFLLIIILNSFEADTWIQHITLLTTKVLWLLPWIASYCHRCQIPTEKLITFIIKIRKFYVKINYISSSKSSCYANFYDVHKYVNAVVIVGKHSCFFFELIVMLNHLNLIHKYPIRSNFWWPNL